MMSRGYIVWKTNWRWGKRELDLVALHGGELVVVEVKACFGNTVNDPREVVARVKQRNMVLATEAFIRIHHCPHPTRFDVISVHYHSGGMEIEHTENAFIASVE